MGFFSFKSNVLKNNPLQYYDPKMVRGLKIFLVVHMVPQYTLRTFDIPFHYIYAQEKLGQADFNKFPLLKEKLIQQAGHRLQ